MSNEKMIIWLNRDGPEGAGLTPMTLDPADFQSPLPTQAVHSFYQDKALGLNVGVWETTTMQEKFGPYPGDEFIWVLEGEFAMLDAQNNAVKAKKGDSVCFRNGAPMSWKQEGYLKKFFMTYLDPQAETPKIDTADGAVIVMDPAAPMTVISEPGAPVERDHTAFTNDAGNLTMGIWDCEAATFGMEPFSVHEFVQVLEGGAEITEQGGKVHKIGPGDCIFIPKGTVCQWHVPTYIKKYYVGLTAG